MHRARSKPSAFTLLELVLVLLIIAIALAAAAPALRGWGRSSRLRAEANQFLAVARWAQTQAVSAGKIHRLHVDATTGQYFVTAQNGTEFERIGNQWGQVFTVHDGFAISLNDLASSQATQATGAIDFFPTGRTVTAWVRISADDGHAIDIKCPSPAEGFELASLQEHAP